jgi:hypothetical protein
MAGLYAGVLPYLQHLLVKMGSNPSPRRCDVGRRPDQGRLDRYEELVPEYPDQVRPSQLARLLAVPRSTVLRDLPALEERGTLLIEDEGGLLSLFRRRR